MNRGDEFSLTGVKQCEGLQGKVQKALTASFCRAGSARPINSRMMAGVQGEHGGGEDSTVHTRFLELRHVWIASEFVSLLFEKDVKNKLVKFFVFRPLLMHESRTLNQGS